MRHDRASDVTETHPTPRGSWARSCGSARVAAGFSRQEALAGQLRFDRTVVAKAETGERLADDRSAGGVVRRRAIWTWSMFGRLAELARSAAGPVPSWFESWLERRGAGALAAVLVSRSSCPGLLQTAEYARALLLAAQTDTSDEAIGALVDARLARKAIFDRPDAPDIVGGVG